MGRGRVRKEQGTFHEPGNLRFTRFQRKGALGRLGACRLTTGDTADYQVRYGGSWAVSRSNRNGGPSMDLENIRQKTGITGMERAFSPNDFGNTLPGAVAPGWYERRRWRQPQRNRPSMGSWAVGESERNRGLLMNLGICD